MKQKVLIALAVLFSAFQMQSQVTFKPGLRGGVNFSHFTKGDDFYGDGTEDSGEFKGKTDFYLGFIGELKLTRFYTLQPEINYSRQGSVYEYRDADNVKQSLDFDVSYLSLCIVNKFTFGEKFNVHVGPTLDIIVDKNLPSEDYYGDYYTESDIDFAFLAGVGFNVTKNFGLEARVKKGIIPVIDFGDSYHSNVVFSVGATYTFNLK